MKDFISEYWSHQALKEKQKPEASWGDVHMMALEVNGIKKFIKNGDVILDAGCANGFSMEKMFTRESRNKLVAFDYVEEMVKNAQKRIRAKGYRNLSSNIYRADIRKIPEDSNVFDVVYTIRVLINLPHWQEQKKAIKELIRVTRPGGLVIISEAFWGALQNLNAIRLIAGLEPLVEHDFNRYLKEKKLEEYLDQSKVSYKVNLFSSFYYLGTRFIRDLNPSLPAGFNKEINKDFFKLSQKYSGSDFGIQKQYILTKWGQS